DRGRHADLLTALAKCKVKAIALDILFIARETNDPVTMKLAKAIKATPQNVVLAADLGSGDHAIGGAERMRLELPDPALLAARATRVRIRTSLIFFADVSCLSAAPSSRGLRETVAISSKLRTGASPPGPALIFMPHSS